MDYNIALLKDIFGLKERDKLSITKVSNGWNLRVRKLVKPVGPEKDFRTILIEAGEDMTVCRKCGAKTYCHPHHIIAKSAGGKDEKCNGMPLCFDCHVGDNGIHLGKWSMLDIISEDFHFELKKRYGVI